MVIIIIMIMTITHMSVITCHSLKHTVGLLSTALDTNIKCTGKL